MKFYGLRSKKTHGFVRSTIGLVFYVEARSVAEAQRSIMDDPDDFEICAFVDGEGEQQQMEDNQRLSSLYGAPLINAVQAAREWVASAEFSLALALIPEPPDRLRSALSLLELSK